MNQLAFVWMPMACRLAKLTFASLTFALSHCFHHRTLATERTWIGGSGNSVLKTRRPDDRMTCISTSV